MRTRTTTSTTGILALVAALSIPLAAQAASSGSITISGSVPTVTSVVVTGSAGFNALDLTVSAANQQVASIQEQSNSTTGYKVTLASANAGALKNGSIGSVSYTAKYNNTSVTLSATPQTVTNVTSATTITNLTKPLTISYTGQADTSLMAGTYSDTLTFTIAAN